MELERILTSEDVIKSINDSSEYVLYLIPELKKIISFEHKHPHHHLDVWNHTLLAVSLSDKDYEQRLTLLLHDIGKPFSYQEENGIRHYYGHAHISELISEKILERLLIPRELKKEILYLIENHDTPITKGDIENNYDLSLKRYKIQYCDSFAHNPNKLEKRKKYLDAIYLLLKK